MVVVGGHDIEVPELPFQWLTSWQRDLVQQALYLIFQKEEVDSDLVEDVSEQEDNAKENHIIYKAGRVHFFYNKHFII